MAEGGFKWGWIVIVIAIVIIVAVIAIFANRQGRAGMIWLAIGVIVLIIGIVLVLTIDRKHEVEKTTIKCPSNEGRFI